MLGSVLGAVLDGAAAAELVADELDGAALVGWAALLLGRAGTLDRLGELLAVGPGTPAAGDEVAGGEGCLVTDGVEVTGAELAGAELAGAELAGAELAGGELTGADDVGRGVVVTVTVGAGELGVRVQLGGKVTDPLGLGRLVLEGPGLPVLAQLSRMLSEVTTAPSRAITRTSYLAGLATTWLNVMIEALGSSKLISVPTGSVPASWPSWRTSSTV